MSTYCAQTNLFQKETLYLKNRSCGPRVSRDLADVLCSATSLRKVKLEKVSLHDSLCEYMREEIISGSMVSIFAGFVVVQTIPGYSSFNFTTYIMFNNYILRW